MSATEKNPNASTRICAVIYDVDGTLYDLRAMRAHMGREVAKAYWYLPLRAMEVIHTVQTYRRAQESVRRSQGQSTGDANSPSAPQMQMEQTAKRLGRSVQSIEPTIRDWMEKRPIPFVAECQNKLVFDMIQFLHAVGVRQSVCSDYPPLEKLRALRVEKLFEVMVTAGDKDVGEFKPSPKGILHAAHLMGLGPEEVAYVGDRPEVDGAAALAAKVHYVDVSELTPDRLASARRQKEPCDVLTELFGL